MKRVTTAKRGRPRKIFGAADFLETDPKGPVQVYFYLKSRIDAGDRMEEAIANAMAHFGWHDRSTIQRKIKPFITGESTRRKVQRELESDIAAAAERLAKWSVDSEAMNESARAFFERAGKLFSKDEMRQLKHCTLPFALKLMDEREELERLRRDACHKLKRKSAADKSAQRIDKA